jgi:hypothetical protein
MFPRNLHRLMLVSAAPVVPLLLLTTAPAAERTRVEGTFSVSYTRRHPLPVSDAPGHALIATEARGTNRSTGATLYMDGAEVRNVEIADLTQGNGPHQGYATFSGQGRETVCKWSGKITTVLDANGKPLTSFEGTWTRVKGPSGHGTYKGRLTGPDSYMVEWEGEVELSPRAAS